MEMSGSWQIPVGVMVPKDLFRQKRMPVERSSSLLVDRSIRPSVASDSPSTGIPRRMVTSELSCSDDEVGSRMMPVNAGKGHN